MFKHVGRVAAVIAALALPIVAPVPAASASTASSGQNLGGRNLTGWTTTLGDAVYSRDGATVTTADIATVSTRSATTLRANVDRRAIMAHVICYRSVPTTLATMHRATYTIRLAGVPAMWAGRFAGQTVEGGLFVWDGLTALRDYGVAWQWSLNPHDPTFGNLSVWTGSGWQAAGYLKPDKAAHRVALTVAPDAGIGTVTVDDITLSTTLTMTAKPADWGADISARLQVEAISMFPRTDASMPEHRVKVSSWTWDQT